MKDAHFMTAKEKEMVLRQWRLFVRHGCKADHFTERIYKHLSLHCSFIAHFNRQGFYGTYFVNPEKTFRFFSQFDCAKGNLSVEYGGNSWMNDPEYSDLNTEMCKVFESCAVQIYKNCQDRTREIDLATAKSLLKKHNIDIQI